MPELTDSAAHVEDLVDSVELLVEAVREAQREKATLKAQEKLVKELAVETRALMVAIDGEPEPVKVKPVESRGKRGTKASVSSDLVPTPPSTEPQALAIKVARKAKGLSQWQLAEKAGTTGPHISNVENGRCKASSALLERIYKALGMEKLS